MDGTNTRTVFAKLCATRERGVSARRGGQRFGPRSSSEKVHFFCLVGGAARLAHGAKTTCWRLQTRAQPTSSYKLTGWTDEATFGGAKSKINSNLIFQRLLLWRKQTLTDESRHLKCNSSDLIRQTVSVQLRTLMLRTT